MLDVHISLLDVAMVRETQNINLIIEVNYTVLTNFESHDEDIDELDNVMWTTFYILVKQ
jgi:hypothetical protein